MGDLERYRLGFGGLDFGAISLGIWGLKIWSDIASTWTWDWFWTWGLAIVIGIENWELVVG
jgi:hypothetical protein